MTFRLGALALATILSFLLLLATPLQAQTPTIQLWHVEFHAQTDLQTLVRDYDVWEVDHDAGRLLVALNANDASLLAQTHSITLASDQSPLQPQPATTAQQGGIPGYACYRTVDETFATHDQLLETYPDLVSEVNIGPSWDKQQAGAPAGDDLRVLVITNQNRPGPKFRFFLMGALHAREYTTAELALRFAESILQGYGTNADATWLLDHGELHLLTIANPDGRRFAETGLLWRKNTNTDATCEFVSLPSTSYGVDLNRNSSFKWDECEGFNCSSSNSCRETYRGETPASEPEVSAIEVYLRSLYADERDDALDAAAPTTKSGIFVSLHSYGRLVLFPWGWTQQRAPNAYGLATIARRLGHPFNYTVCQAGGFGCLYQTDGTTDDFGYGELGLASFTIELGTAFFQSCTFFESSIVQQGLASLRYAFKVAQQPYLLAEGPEVVSLITTPHTNTSQVTISAMVDANRIAPLSGLNIAAITEPIEPIRQTRLTIGTPPWDASVVAYPLAAVDGAYDSMQETASATLDLACLPTGRHTLYAHAQDEGGDWGVVSAQFITVTNTSPFTITAPSTDAETSDGTPVTYTLALTNTATTTTSFSIETNSPIAPALSPSTPVTLPPGSDLTFTIAITPQNTPTQEKTADTLVPTEIIVRSVEDPSHCRQITFATQVVTWPYRVRLLIIGKY